MSIVLVSRSIVNTQTGIDHVGMNTMQTLGQFVRAKRQARRQTNRELADVVGMDPATLSRLENGGMKTLPEPETLRTLANALNVTVPDLLEAAGYLTATDRETVSANPFPPADIRHRVVEQMKTVELDGPEHAFWMGHFALQLRMYRDIAAGAFDEIDSLAGSDHEAMVDAATGT